MLFFVSPLCIKLEILVENTARKEQDSTTQRLTRRVVPAGAVKTSEHPQDSTVGLALGSLWKEYLSASKGSRFTTAEPGQGSCTPLKGFGLSLEGCRGLT